MVRIPDRTRDLAVVSLYGIWDSMGDGRAIYAEATLHRAISDLTPLLQRPRTDVVLAGDLNIYRNWQHGSPDADRLWADRYDTVFDRLAAYGLTYRGPLRGSATDGGTCRCGLRDDCRHVNTYRTSAGNLFQLDYVFASSAVDVTRCDPADPPASRESRHRAWQLSDHLAVLVDVVLA
jgi:endonuclease/exonuclease/phosphatase family metal-dependent hydrolase